MVQTEIIMGIMVDMIMALAVGIIFMVITIMALAVATIVMGIITTVMVITTMTMDLQVMIQALIGDNQVLKDQTAILVRAITEVITTFTETIHRPRMMLMGTTTVIQTGI